MLRFQDNAMLWLWLLIPIGIGVFFYYKTQREQLLQRLGDHHLVKRLIPHFSSSRLYTKIALILSTIFMAVLAIANLQGNARSQKIQRKGIDVVIALDVSKSMLAKDVAPDRLQAAKQCISRLFDQIGNNRVGLILFAGRSYLSVPLTVDIAALKMNLATASTEAVPSQGTVLAEAIAMARKTFNTKDLRYKSIILISDGEDHDEESLSQVKKAVEEGITIQTIGIGSDQGAPIFDPETGQNKLDRNGNQVITKLNEQELQQIAAQGNGQYYRLFKPEQTAKQLAQQINSAEQRDFGTALFTDYESYFQYFLFIAFVLLVIEYFIPEYKKVKA